MRRTGSTLVVALALAVVALLAVSGDLGGATRWTPDGLFYQARSLELRGVERAASLERVFEGPLGADLRRRDPERSGDPAWVAYNAQFYARRVTVPLAAAALEPVSGSRALLDVSLAGYIAAILAVFALLRLSLSLPAAAAATLATILLPALTHHAGLPLTDTWGLALETLAFAFGILALERGPRWVAGWAIVMLALAFTRDSMWIPILAAAWLALSLRSRVAWGTLAAGVAAALPVLLLFSVPTRELLAQMLNDAQPAPDASWASIVERYPAAIVDLLQADGGFVRDGAWYSAAYLAGGLALLFALARGERGDPAASLLKAGALGGVAYVLAVPVFSAFRLELVLVPMAAYGLGLGAERALAFASSFLAKSLDSGAQADAAT
jgi:hypothetical protein